MSQPVAILLVHGIGATRRHAMMDAIVRQIRTCWPHWQLCDHYEAHEFPEFRQGAAGDAEADGTRPHIHMRKGHTGRAPITIADGYWGDISLVREGILNVIWGMLVNMFGLRYLSYVALKRHRAFQVLISLFVFVVAAINLPFNLFTMLHAMLVVHFQSHLMRGDLPESESGNLVYLDFDGDLHRAAGASFLVAGLLGMLFALWVRHLTREAWFERPLLSRIVGGGFFFGLGATLISIAFFYVSPLAFETTQAWKRFERSATLFVKDDIIASYGDLVRNKRWALYRHIPIAGDGRVEPTSGVTKLKCSANTPALPSVRKALSDVQLTGRCITPAGVYLSALYVLQTIPLWFLVVLSAIILSYLAVLCLIRWILRRPLAGLLVSVGSHYTMWFFFGSLLLFVIPVDIITDLAIQRSFYPATEIHHYRAYWFEIGPVLAVLGSAALAAVVYATWRAVAIRRAGRAFAAEGPGARRWFPAQGQTVASHTLVGPRLVAPAIFLVGMYGYALFIHLATSFIISQRLGLSRGAADAGCAVEATYFAALERSAVCVPYHAFVGLDSVWLTLVILAVLLGFALIGRFFRTGLKAAMDVVNHFTAPERDFPVRQRIADRFRASAEALISQADCPVDPRVGFQLETGAEAPAGERGPLRPHLIIMAHSQGTVITADRVLDGDLKALLDSGRVGNITIFTFGSPLTNIYQRYFEDAYPDMRHCANASLDALQQDRRVRWYNLYRIDDYVGTYIQGPDTNFPANIPLKPGGHVNYWTGDAFGIVGTILREEHGIS